MGLAYLVFLMRGTGNLETKFLSQVLLYTSLTSSPCFIYQQQFTAPPPADIVEPGVSVSVFSGFFGL